MMQTRVRAPLMVAAAMVLSAASLVHAQTNFAGSWVLDWSQSQLSRHDREGAAAPPGSAPSQKPEVRLTVEQDGNVVKATRTVKHGNTERSFSETYTVDGPEQTFTGPRNGALVTKAAWDGVRLVVNSNKTITGRSSDEIQFSRASVWSLSPDGRTLTIQTTFQGPRGERIAKRVYQRA